MVSCVAFRHVIFLMAHHDTMQPRFVASREDGSEGTIEAVNAEPHDANIRGAICAERAAMCLEPRLKNWRIWPLGY